jgi:hypothetical protein
MQFNGDKSKAVDLASKFEITKAHTETNAIKSKSATIYSYDDVLRHDLYHDIFHFKI